MTWAPLDASQPDWQTQLRARFPILAPGAARRPLVYLDSAASAQKPERVIQRLERFYRREYANIHRGVHFLSVDATAAWDRARAAVARFLNSPEPESCLFVRGATEAINLFARSVVGPRLHPGDAILVTELEHHANLVPWHLLAADTGAVVQGVRLDPQRGELDGGDFAAKLREWQPKLVAFGHVSNVLGTINPVAELVARVRELSPQALVLVDGAQAVPHGPVDVQALGCDAYAFSGHKLYGPTGIGVLWARRELTEQARPYQGGGDMIERVEVSRSTFRSLPERFEAGTPHIAGALGLAAAIEEVESWPIAAVRTHEVALVERLRSELTQREGVRVLPAGPQRTGAVPFVVDGLHPHDLGTALDQRGVAIRVGHHCCQPLMRCFGLSATARASIAAYSNDEDVSTFLSALDETRAFFAK